MDEWSSSSCNGYTQALDLLILVQSIYRCLRYFVTMNKKNTIFSSRIKSSHNDETIDALHKIRCVRVRLALHMLNNMRCNIAWNLNDCHLASSNHKHRCIRCGTQQAKIFNLCHSVAHIFTRYHRVSDWNQWVIHSLALEIWFYLLCVLCVRVILGMYAISFEIPIMLGVAKGLLILSHNSYESTHNSNNRARDKKWIKQNRPEFP